MYLAIIILPLLASIASGFFGRKVGVKGAQLITCVCVIITTILSFILFIEVGLNSIPVSLELFRWIDSESLNVSWGFTFDSLTVSMLIPVLIVSCLVHIYSIGYMSHDPHNQRFFSYLSLFTFMMIILVTANNFLLMFVGWEGVGVCSYLLVNFWFTRIAANQSSISAFLTNRVGDCFLTIGMFTILWSFGNIDYSTVFALSPYINENIITIIGICLLIGAMAKSSQIGLHVWLPMAMEGPTPVSALIHAATMVTAGVYLLMRTSPLIEYSSTVLILCLWIGAFTTIFSSLIGLFQQDIKKVIAYSTMSQLGMMFIAVGLSSYNIALFHLINHAFYKGLLFLGAGAVIHAVADNQDFRKYGGLKVFLPLTYSVMLIASLSLVAFPFMTGFYSKDFILESAYGTYNFSTTVVYSIATVGAMFTTLYSIKVLYLTFLTNPNGPLVNYNNAHEGNIFMSLPLIILAIFSIFFGYISKDIFIGWGSGFFADNSLFFHAKHEIILDTEFAVPILFKILPLFFTISLSLMSIVIFEFFPKFVIYFKSSGYGYNIFSFFNQRFYIEMFYNKYITNMVLKWGGQTTKVLDKGSIELLGPFGLELIFVNLSSNISKLDTGVITSYALYILIGLMFYLFIPHLNILDNSLLILILAALLGLNSKLNNNLYNNSKLNNNLYNNFKDIHNHDHHIKISKLNIINYGNIIWPYICKYFHIIRIYMLVLFYMGLFSYYVYIIYMVLPTYFFFYINIIITIIAYFFKYMCIILTLQFMVFNALISIKSSKSNQINGFINFLRLKWSAHILPIFLDILRYFSNNYKYYVSLLIIIGLSVCVLRYLYMSIYLNDKSNPTFWDVLEMLLTLFPIVSGLSVLIQKYLPNKPHINIDNSYEKLSTANKIISTITLHKFVILLLCFCLSKYYIIPLVISISVVCMHWLEVLSVSIKSFIISEIKIIYIKSTIKHVSFARPGRIYTDCNIKNTHGYKTSKHFINSGKKLKVIPTRLYKSNSMVMLNNNNNNNSLFGKNVMDKFKYDFSIEKQFNYMLQNNSVKKVILDIASSLDGKVMSSIVLHESHNGKYVKFTDLKNILYGIQQCSNNNNNNIVYHIDLKNQFRFILDLNDTEIINLASSNIISLSEQITMYLTSIRSKKINLATNNILSLSEQITTYLTSVRSDNLSLRTNISSPLITNNEIINLTSHNNFNSLPYLNELYINQIVENRYRNIDVYMYNRTKNTQVEIPYYQYTMEYVPRTKNIMDYDTISGGIPQVAIPGLNDFCKQPYLCLLRTYYAIHHNDISRLPLYYSRRIGFKRHIFEESTNNKLNIIKGCIMDILDAKLKFYGDTLNSVGKKLKNIDNKTLKDSSNHELDILLNCINSNNYNSLPYILSKSFEKSDLGVIEHFPFVKSQFINRINYSKRMVENWLETHLKSMNEYRNMSEWDFHNKLVGLDQCLLNFKYVNIDDLVYLNLNNSLEKNIYKHEIFMEYFRYYYPNLSTSYVWDCSVHNLVNTGYTCLLDINRVMDNKINYLTVYGALSETLYKSNLNQPATNFEMFNPSNLQYIFKVFKFIWDNNTPPVELSGWGVIAHCYLSMINNIFCIYNAYNDILSTHKFFIVGANWDIPFFRGIDVKNHWPDMYNSIQYVVENYGDDELKYYFYTIFNDDVHGLSRMAFTFIHYQNNLRDNYVLMQAIQDKLYAQITGFKYQDVFKNEMMEYKKNSHLANIELIKMRLYSNY